MGNWSSLCWMATAVPLSSSQMSVPASTVCCGSAMPHKAMSAPLPDSNCGVPAQALQEIPLARQVRAPRTWHQLKAGDDMQEACSADANSSARQATSELREQLQQGERAPLTVVPADAVRPDALLQRVWSPPQPGRGHRCAVLVLRHSEGGLQSHHSRCLLRGLGEGYCNPS